MWWVFEDGSRYDYEEGMVELDEDDSAKDIIPNDETVIPCQTREIHRDPVKIPMLPDLPDLLGTGLPEEDRRKETKLIKIVALFNRLVGLTNKGHVLKLDGLHDKNPAGTWHYVCKGARKILYLYSNGDTQLPNYSEIDKVREHPAFHRTTDRRGRKRPPKVILSSNTMLITDVSHIASISSGFPV